MIANLIQTVFDLFLALFTRQEREGTERIPEPPYIFAINHIGFFDVVVAYTIAGRAKMAGWAAEKWEKHPLYGPILRAGGAIFVKRGQVDRYALNAALEALKSGLMFGIAPEGTRSPNAALARGKTGVAYLAAESGAPVVPAALTGTERLLGKVLRFQRPRLSIRVGEPVYLPPVPDENRSQALRANTDEIMCRIAAMLPASYRGYYADHPRTLELLASGYGEEPVEANAPSPVRSR